MQRHLNEPKGKWQNNVIWRNKLGVKMCDVVDALSMFVPLAPMLYVPLPPLSLVFWRQEPRTPKERDEEGSPISRKEFEW